MRVKVPNILQVGWKLIRARVLKSHSSSSSSSCAISKASGPGIDSPLTTPRSSSTVPLHRPPPHPSDGLSACANRIDTGEDTAAISLARGQQPSDPVGGGGGPDKGDTARFTELRPEASATAADLTTRSTIDMALSRSFSTSAPAGFERFLRRASNQAFFSSRRPPRALRDSSYAQNKRARGCEVS